MSHLVPTGAAAVKSSAMRSSWPWTFGRVVAVLLVIVTLPLWLLAALLVWASVGRPLLFRQVRVGAGTRGFTMVKFRTMRETRDADGALLPDASRETPATRLMRRIRIDELPQLLSIARGDMAFVGPRPLLPETIAGFADLGQVRCAVAPGLTGWAQVNGNSRLSNREKLALDLWYVNHRSIALDVKIIALTLWTIVRGERIEKDNIARARDEMPMLRMFLSDQVTP